MILDLNRFAETERPVWSELEELLNALETDAGRGLSLDEANRIHYLYQRAAADLARVRTFAANEALAGYLEQLVARAYAEIHEVRQRSRWRALIVWLMYAFPQAVRRNARALNLTIAVTVAGSIFGGAVVMLDYEQKTTLMPFAHLMGDPAERVAMEEEETEADFDNNASFSAYLMNNNIRVSIFALALGVTYGIGTFGLLLYNGAMIGAVAADYIMAGETVFLFAWLLPHGVIEIPAILLAGQAGFVLAGALVGWRSSESLRSRLRSVRSDISTLILGVALMLVWAGIIESFLSQFHAPVLPYSVKIAFGLVELALLGAYLYFAGRNASLEEPGHV